MAKTKKDKVKKAKAEAKARQEVSGEASVAAVKEAGEAQVQLKRKSSELETQAAAPVKKLKKKKKRVEAVAEAVVVEPIVAAKDAPSGAHTEKRMGARTKAKLLGKKKNKRKIGSAEGERMVQTSSTTEGGESTAATKTKKRKKVKDGGTDMTNQAESSSSKTQRKTDCALSDDDSFFAGEDDAKHGDPKVHKVPDHLHPRKVWVGGLPYAATQESVRADFAECGEIDRFDMPMNAEGLPAGNAFIYFKTEEGVAKALEYDGTDYQGRSIKVRRAVKQAEGKGKDGKGKGKGKDEDMGRQRNDGTTVFVGGLSRDIEIETLKRDFAECGEVEAVRMVKGSDGVFKGTAFIVFKDDNGVKEALKFHNEDYGGRVICVRRAGDAGKGKDGKSKGKGKDGKDKGKDKGKSKGKSKDGSKGICYKFKEGTCTFGDKCIFKHE